MERRWLTGLVATIAFVQSMGLAQAQEVVVDLPNPFDTGVPQQPAQPAPPAPLPQTPVQAQYSGTAQITSISRKSGGTVARVNLNPALALMRLELKVQKSQVKIYEATVVTTAGQRISVREFKDTGLLQTQSTLVSENLNLTDSIASIEIRAESFQVESDLELKAISDSGVPRLTLQRADIVQQPAQPTLPAQPSQPNRPPPPPPLPRPLPQDPRPGQPPRPRPPGQCLGDLCIGDHAYNNQRDYREVIIVGLDSGTYTLRFLDNGGQGGGWTRDNLSKMSGCVQDVCIGAEAYNISRDSRKVTVVGIEQNGNFVLRFQDNGGIGGNWSRSDLAFAKGCVGDVCVGARAINISRDYRRVTVAAIQMDGHFVLRFEDNGASGGNWSASDLAFEKGCMPQGRVCVGTTAYNIERDYRLVRVVAIQADGKAVLSFQDNGMLGGNWDLGALALLTGCGNGYCVGEDVVVVTRNYRKARIAGIQMNGGYVLRFLDNGIVGGNWQNGDLTRAR